MAKPNYAFEKRQRDLAKKAKELYDLLKKQKYAKEFPLLKGAEFAKWILNEAKKAQFHRKSVSKLQRRKSALYRAKQSEKYREKKQ